MKNTLKRLALAIFASTFLFGGCTQLTDPVAVYSGPGDNKVDVVGEQTNITIKVSSSADIITFGSNNARTIVPTAIDGTATGVKFYIWGTNTITSQEFGPEEITFTADAPSTTVGIVSKLFTRATYDLNLAFVSAANITKFSTENSPTIVELKKYASLTANSDVDLRYNERVYFYLTPNTDNTAANGSLSLQVKAEGWDPTDAAFAGYTMATGLYNIADDTLVANSGVTEFQGAIGTASSVLTATEKEYKMESIAAGTYEFRISFTKGDKTYTTSEDVIVLANEPTNGNFDVLDIIEKAPSAPQTFVATYKDPDTNLNDATFYNVALSWDASAIINENYFELETLQLLDSCVNTTAATTIVDDATWTSTINDTYLTQNVKAVVWNKTTWAESTDCTIYEGGSLKRDSEQIIMQLPLGSRYFARIRSVNDAGESAWTYLDLDGGTDDSPLGYKAFIATDWYINRFQIRYELNGGTVKTGDLPLNTFYTYNGTEIEIQTPETAVGAANPTLEIVKTFNANEDYWQKWTKTDGTVYTDTSTAPVTNPAYTGYKDLVLVANYDAVTDMNVEMIQPADYEIKDDDITLTFKKDAAVVSITATDGIYIVSLADVNKLVLGFETEHNYEKIAYTIEKTNSSDAKTYEAVLSGAGTPVTYTNTTEVDITGWMTSKYLLTWKAWHSTRGNSPYTNYMLVELTQ